MTLLVTGGAGFIGSAIRDYYSDQGHKVFWTSRRQEHLKSDQCLMMDLTNFESIEQCLKQAKPDAIIHLAAQSSVKDSFKNWNQTLQSNLIGSYALFQAVVDIDPKIKIVSIGSSAEYGTHPEKASFDEETSLTPSSPYGFSKMCQSYLANYFHNVHSLHVSHVRPFAVIGPEKYGDFISDMSQQVLKAKKEGHGQLKFGDIHRERDFIDVEDFCLGLDLVLSKGKSGESYNIGNGEAVHLKTMIELATDILELQVQKLEVDESKLRASDDFRLVADIDKLKVLGYQRKVSLRQSLSKIIDYRKSSH